MGMMHNDRTQILSKYFESIGISGKGKWNLFLDTVIAKTTPVSKFEPQLMALK